MKGLLLKEFYCSKYIKRSVLIFLLFGLVYSFSMKDGGNYLTVVLGLITMMSVMNSFTYDEYYHWNRYAMGLPVKRSVLVASKYVYALIIWSACLALNLIIAAAMFLLQRFGHDSPNIFEQFFLSFGITSSLLMGIAIILPLLFRFDLEKIRLLCGFLMMAPIGLVVLGLVFLSKMFDSTFATILTALAMFILSILTSLASFQLSLHFFKKKEY